MEDERRLELLMNVADAAWRLRSVLGMNPIWRELRDALDALNEQVPFSEDER